MTVPNTEQKGNVTDLKLTSPNHAESRFLHIQPGANGLGEASAFARELHVVAPELYRRRWA
jgi:hypothetical protein